MSESTALPKKNVHIKATLSNSIQLKSTSKKKKRTNSSLTHNSIFLVLCRRVNIQRESFLTRFWHPRTNVN